MDEEKSIINDLNKLLDIMPDSLNKAERVKRDELKEKLKNMEDKFWENMKDKD